MTSRSKGNEGIRILEEFDCEAIANPSLFQTRTAGSTLDGVEAQAQQSAVGTKITDDLRRELHADPAWAAYFTGMDLFSAGDGDEALSIWRHALETFLERGDEVGIDQVSTTIKNMMSAKGLIALVNGFDQLVTSFRQKRSNVESIWNWWRMNNLPWR